MILLAQSKNYHPIKHQPQMTAVSVIKQFANCYCEKLTNILNDCLKENRFPNLMKVAEISPF